MKSSQKKKNDKKAPHNIFERDDRCSMFKVPVDDRLEQSHNRFRMNVADYIRKSGYGLSYEEPQGLWTKGCPLGNGDLGAMVYGSHDALNFALGKTDLWDYRSYGESMHPPIPLEELRDIITRGDHKAFEETLEKQRKTHDKKPAITGKPGGMFRIEMLGSSLPRGYLQELCIADAECRVSCIPIGYNPPSRKDPEHRLKKLGITSFIHASANLLAVKISYDLTEKFPLSLLFTLWREQDPAAGASVVKKSGDRMWLRQELPGGEHFVIMADTPASNVQIQDSFGRVQGLIKQVESSGTEIYLSIATSRETADPEDKARATLEAAKKEGWEKMRQSHRRWWHGFWDRGCVATPFRDVERYWYYALYMQACICRPGRTSPGLQGNWIKENYPAWNADFHTNVNMQVLNWGHYTANRLELGEPLYRLLLDVLERCKKDTKSYFGTRGARYPISFGPDGAETCGGMLLSIYIGAGGWLAQHLWWHYMMTGDRKFLAEYAWPLLKECSLFYIDYMMKEPDGTYCLFPTLHMEAVCNKIAGAGKNATWDLAFVTRCLQMAIAAGEELKESPKLLKELRDALDRLAPIPAREDGVWLEFSDKGGLWHMWDWARISPPIFPGELVSADSGPEELRRQALASIEEYWAYRKEPAKLGHFPGVLLACSLFRMGMAERGLEVAKNTISGLNPSGFTTNREGYFFQVDSPPGMSVLLSEMLLQSHHGVIRIFPATPETEEPVRFHSLRAQGGFLVSAERRQGATLYVIARSLCGNRLRMLNPFTEGDPAVQVKIYLLPQQERMLESVENQIKESPWLDNVYLPGQYIEFDTVPGQTYLISREIPFITDVPVENI